MTTPSERTRALRQTRDFLRELMSSEEPPNVPDNIRREARHLLRHYPDDMFFELMSRALPNQFGAIPPDP